MANIGTTHEDMIHDASLDYYGKRLATCSSDKTIKIFEIEGETHRLIETLRGHEGPVWQVAWAHPKFGSILASASYDGRVLIWREDGERWSIIAQHTAHQASVNSVEWAPHELGALLLCGSSDGCVSIVEFQDDGKTDSKLFPAHAVGCNAVAWAPTTVKGSLVQTGSDTSKAQLDARHFATGGCDNLIKIWQYNSTTGEYDLEDTLEGHSDWVRDVAWAPSVLPKSYIASASQDKTVQIWTKEGNEPWKRDSLTPEKFSDVLWRVSWSFSGNVLAVSGADNKVTLWRENLQGEWKSVGSVEE